MGFVEENLALGQVFLKVHFTFPPVLIILPMLCINPSLIPQLIEHKSNALQQQGTLQKHYYPSNCFITGLAKC